MAAPQGARSIIEGQVCRAVAYEQLTGAPRPGERVRLEVSALDRRLGTGGHAMVSARPDVLPADTPVDGHLVKARYMPDQVMVAGVDEQDSPHHAVLAGDVDEPGLDGTPVIVADLHSSLVPVLTGIRSPGIGSPDTRAAAGAAESAPPRVVYVMTDDAALPLAYSRSAAALGEAGWLAGTITVGQAWGGDLEAVSVHNALLAARSVLGAQVIVVIQGPGNLGTGTTWGFSGVATGEAVNAAAALGGRPVACLRVSRADARARHRGVSHHSLTAYGRVAMAAADVVVPLLPGDFGERIRAQARRLCALEQAPGHRLIEVDTGGLLQALELAQQETGVRLTTMGRDLSADAEAFLAAAAAGRHGARLVAADG